MTRGREWGMHPLTRHTKARVVSRIDAEVESARTEPGTYSERRVVVAAKPHETFSRANRRCQRWCPVRPNERPAGLRRRARSLWKVRDGWRVRTTRDPDRPGVRVAEGAELNVMFLGEKNFRSRYRLRRPCRRLSVAICLFVFVQVRSRSGKRRRRIGCLATMPTRPISPSPESAACQIGERVHRGRGRGIELAVRCVVLIVQAGPTGFGLAYIWTKPDSGTSFLNIFKHA